jgi:hypothetical protein
MLQALTPQAVQDTIARITTDPRYQRDVTDTVLSRLWRWFSETLSRILGRVTGSRETQWLVLGVLALLILAAIARAVLVARARRQALALAATQRTAADHLADADAASARGEHTHGAHALYAAVVTSLVERSLARAHPSMTVGDYARALRGTPMRPTYNAFARLYERVVYGDGECTAAQFLQLRALATSVLTPSAALATAA